MQVPGFFIIDVPQGASNNENELVKLLICKN